MSDTTVAQSNVDYIVQALVDSPEDHAWEVNEERLTIEYGERVACDMAAGDALGYGLPYFAVFAALRIGSERSDV